MGSNVRFTTVCGFFLLVAAVVLMSTPGGEGVPVFGCPPHHFVNKVHECLQPYWSVADLFKHRDDRPADYDSSHQQRHNGVNDEVMAEHMCMQFETALMCLHTALTECPSHANVKYVQSKLGSDWAVEIRDICVGQSGLVTNRVPRDELAHVGDLLESSGELVREYFADIEESIADTDNYDGDTNDESIGDKRHKIVVVVPSVDDDVYQEIIVDLRKKVRFRPRNRHTFKHFPSLDRSTYSGFGNVDETQPISAASVSKMASSVGTHWIFCMLVTRLWYVFS